MNVSGSMKSPASAARFGASPFPTPEQSKDILLKRLSGKGWGDEIQSDKVQGMVMGFGGPPEILIFVEPGLQARMLDTLKNKLYLLPFPGGQPNEFRFNGLKVGVWENHTVYPASDYRPLFS